MSKRDQSIDLVKIIAMTMVIILHTNMHNLIMPFGYVLFWASGIAIPLFFMVSGYLMATKQKVTYRYSLKKILNIIKFITIISFPLALYDLITGLANINGFITQIFILPYIQDGYFWPMWYLGAMCIMYAILPLLNRYIIRNGLIIYTLSILVIIETFAFYLNITQRFEEHIIQTFRLWNFISYFLIGVLICKLPEKQIVRMGGAVNFECLFYCSFLA